MTALRTLSRLVVRHFEWRRLALRIPRAEARSPSKGTSHRRRSGIHAPPSQKVPGFEAVLDAINEGLMVCQVSPPTAPQRLKLMAFNAVAERLLSVSLHERSGADLAELLPGIAGSRPSQPTCGGCGPVKPKIWATSVSWEPRRHSGVFAV
jgi:hypothetical protein